MVIDDKFIGLISEALTSHEELMENRYRFMKENPGMDTEWAVGITAEQFLESVKLDHEKIAMLRDIISPVVTAGIDMVKLNANLQKIGFGPASRDKNGVIKVVGIHS